MKPAKRLFISLICSVLSILMFLSCSPILSVAVTNSESGGSTSDGTSLPPSRFQAAYSFDSKSDLTADVGGQYPLSTKEFGSSLIQAADGHHKGAMKGYVHMDHSLFDGLSQFSLAFRVKFTLAEARNESTLFLVNGTGGESMELQFVAAEDKTALKLTVFDGQRTSHCTYDVSGILSETAQWIHVAVTYKVSNSVSLLTLYVNGKSAATSLTAAYVDLSGMECLTAAFHGISLDDLYFTNHILEPARVSALSDQPVEEFFASEQENMKEEPDDTPNPVFPVVPTERHDYSWAAYLFDGTFAAGTDYHSGDIPATVDPSCVLIDTSKLTEKYGYAVIRRESSAPSAYLTLDSRLFYGQSSFTFSCWVYRNGKTRKNSEYLLDLKGTGVLRFAPYGAKNNDSFSPSLEYTDSRGNIQTQSFRGGDPRNQWVHYALTVSHSGEITVYVDGSAVGTFSSGVSPETLAFSQCRVVTGSSGEDSVRTAVDEIYVSPKALPAADIRKIHTFGLKRYTSEVLPDPGQTDTGEGPVNPYAPDAVDLREDAYNQTGSIFNGFVGTTFDERNNVGQDWNNGANVTVTGGRLTQGITSYGLSLDGSSFVRYPLGTLDGAESLTVSLSYFWEGPGTETDRSQRLFDFSRKSSSVAEPSAYIFLETGNGLSGLRFGISDGISSTYLTCDYNAVNTWTRVTVTVHQGKVTLYLNDKVAATGETQVTLSSICPNFSYLGRSGVKGDPMFTGVIDEVYLSSQPLPADQVPLFINGISAAILGEGKTSVDLWSILLTGIIVIAVASVLAVIVVIIVILARKEKKSSEEEAPLPVSIAAAESSGLTVVGPRSARRARSAERLEEGDATVKFQKVDPSRYPGDSPEKSQLTAKFRKITDESPECDEED